MLPRCAHHLHALKFCRYFVFKPVAFLCYTCGKSVTLLRLFDISNMNHGAKRRQFDRVLSVFVAVTFGVCNLISVVTSWYAAGVAMQLRELYASSAAALCNSSSSTSPAAEQVAQLVNLGDYLYGLQTWSQAVLYVIICFMFVFAALATSRSIKQLLANLEQEASVDVDISTSIGTLSLVGAAKRKHRNLQLFVSKTYATVIFVLLTFTFRAVIDIIVALGLVVGSRPDCPGLCLPCQHPVFIYANTVEFNTPLIFSCILLAEPISTLVALWGMVPPSQPPKSKITDMIEQKQKNGQVQLAPMLQVPAAGGTA